MIGKLWNVVSYAFALLRWLVSHVWVIWTVLSIFILYMLTIAYWKVKNIFSHIIDTVKGEFTFYKKLITSGLTAEEAVEKIAPPPVELWLDTVKNYCRTNAFTLVELAGWIALALVAVYIFLWIAARAMRFFWFSFSRVQFACGFSEKMQPGSVLSSAATMPNYQVEIWVRHGKGFMKSGQGFLTKFGLFTAYHVIEDATEVRLVKGDKMLEITRDSFQQLESDVALYKMTQPQAAKMQLTQGTLSTLETPSARAGLIVKVQAFGQRTMGALKRESNEAFGLCEYAGSTIKGFSGAPYCVGKRIFGMHIGGASMNIGYEAAYLYMLGKAQLEDTEDWLEEELSTLNSKQWNEDVYYQQSPYDPSDYRLRLAGQYYNVDRDFIDRVVKKHSRGKVEYSKPQYDDETLEKVEDLPLVPRKLAQYQDTKNEMLPQHANVGALGKPKLKGKSVPKKRLMIQEETDSSTQSGSESETSSNGQQKTPALQKEALQDTLKSSKKQKKRRTRRQRNNARQRSRSPLNRTKHGK